MSYTVSSPVGPAGLNLGAAAMTQRRNGLGFVT